MLRVLLPWLALLGVGLAGLAQAQYCDQPFAPARGNWEWQYRVSGANPSTYSLRKVGIGNTSFVQVRQTSEGKEETKYRCTAEGIAPAEVGGSGSVRAADMGGQAASYELEVVKVTGVSVADYDSWEIGNSWKLVMEIKGTGQQGIIRYNISGTLESTYKVVAQEAIITPAGKFSAYKLQTTFATRIRATAGPITIPFNFDTEGTSWYAEGVGMVRSIQKARSGENITELVALKKQ